MGTEDKNKKTPDKAEGNTGNASNPSPGKENSPGENQLLDKKAEKYLRESGNIEDMPDPEEEDEAGGRK
jgi:hypothetical protein